ncbi:MAG: DNA polymerase IV [Tepidisphaerales bacterium]
MNAGRCILHVDMDAFYAAVERLDDPSLAGKPLLVGGRDGRGVVCAASYEARVFGCRSAMPMAQALRLCPHAVVRPVRFDRYREVSRQIHTVFERFTPDIEPLALDEAFLDLTASLRALGPALDLARQLKRNILRETGCTASVGISYCKFLAKLASDLEKPDGLVVLTADDVETRLPALPVTRIWGVGPAVARRLADLAVHTIGELRNADPRLLASRLGRLAPRLLDLAHGRDDRPVVTDRRAKSIGHEHTFFDPLMTRAAAETELLAAVEHVAFRLRRAGRAAPGVTVKLRTTDYRTLTRSTTLPLATDVTAELYDAARAAFATWADTHFEPMRLLGVQLHPLHDSPQQALFDLSPRGDHDRQARVDAATDRIRQRFGPRAIRRLGPPVPSQPDDPLRPPDVNRTLPP